MRTFFELVKLSARRQFTYRAAALAGLATNCFFGLLRAAVIVALYGERGEAAGISLQAAITYTGISQAVIAFLDLFGWWQVIQSVYSGQISGDLLKPVDYFRFWMAQDLGRALVNLAGRGVLLMLFYAAVFDIVLPEKPGQWLGLLAALLLAWMVSFAWRFLVNLAAFWVPNAVGIGRLGYALSWLMSGFLMPLRFYPEWFQKLCYLTPFPHMINTIVEVYLGLLSGPEMLVALLQQALWAVALTSVCYLVLRAGVRRLVILGG